MLDDLQHLYEMHNEELQQVLENVTTYLLKSNKVFRKICENEQALQDRSAIALVAYDKFFTIVSNMLDKARKFNFHFFINDLEKKSTRTLFEALDGYDMRGKNCNSLEALADEAAVLPLDPSTKATKQLKTNTSEIMNMNIKKDEFAPNFGEENVYDYKNISIPPAEENDGAGLKDQLSKIYLGMDLSKYEIGNILKGSVTYIKDLETLSFYVCDAESKEVQQIATLKNMFHLRQYTGIPPKNEVFGLVLDNIILRAIREESLNESTRPCGECNVLLLDFGEISIVSASDVTYRLPMEMQNIPAQAILCQLNGIIGQSNLTVKELQSCLQKLEYGRATFVVKSKEDQCKLVLELITDKIKRNAIISKINHNSEKPDLVSSHKEIQLPKVISTNPFLTDAAINIDDNDEAIPLRALPVNPPFTGEIERLPNGLTPEEMDMLTEEPLNTSNAMTAVLGYNPRDEQRICRFYNPRTGACFKGANCRLEHTPVQPDGWTKDRLPTRTIIDNYLPTTRYTAGLIINITATHVGKIEYFYAQINDPDNPTEPLIWNDDDIPHCMRLTKPPMLYDLVRARYEDNMWYRAKVIEFDESGKIFKLFYVDYGNHQNVLLKHMAYCDRSTERFPFQAVICRIADIMQNPDASTEQRDNGVRTLNALILNHSFDVKVVNHHEDFIVRFMGAQYSPIPKRLISMGCAKQFHSSASSSAT